MINQLAREAHENAKSKGFFDEPRNIGEMLCLIHSEVSEALECDRKNQFPTHDPEYVLGIEDNERFKDAFQRFIKGTFADELADIVIRVMDLASFKDVDLEAHIKAKMRYNSLRPHKHGKKY